MVWIPFLVAAIAFAALVVLIVRQAVLLRSARENMPIRILVLGSRGKSGTVRLVRALLSHSGIPTYAKITGTVAQEIDVAGTVTDTFRLGPVSASEMADVLIRAGRNGARAGVFECMAVAPKLIAFVQNKIVQAPIVIIPTIRLDHLEDEGDTLTTITKNTLSSLNHVTTLITGETNEESLKVMRWWAKRNHVTLITISSETQVPELPGHHPTNIRTALAVAELVDISHEDALVALAQATTEPDSEAGWEIIDQGKIFRLSNVGGANDPQSAAEAILRAQPIAADTTLIPILVNRWDRPLRSVAFGYSMRANAHTPRVGVVGSAMPQTKKILREQGFDSHQILSVGWFSTLTKKQTLRTLHRLCGDRPDAWFVLVENIHAFPADHISSTFRSVGRPIRNNDQHELGADNV